MIFLKRDWRSIWMSFAGSIWNYMIMKQCLQSSVNRFRITIMQEMRNFEREIWRRKRIRRGIEKKTCWE